MFELTRETLERIKERVELGDKKLVLANGTYFAASTWCSNSPCYASCTGNCKGGCKGSCTRSCQGERR